MVMSKHCIGICDADWMQCLPIVVVDIDAKLGEQD